MKKITPFIFASLLGAVLALGGYKLLEKEAKPTVIIQEIEKTPIQFTSNSSSGPEVSSFTYAAEKTVNSVVHVFTETELAPMNNPWAELFGYQNVEPHIQRGSGSGVIISKNGYIVTNNHVIEGAQRIKVNLNNNKTYFAEVIGRDPSTDLALLKIEEEDLPAISFGNSDELRIGEWILAVGNPFNLTSTVTAGIVSAKARDIDILQPDYYNGISPVESFIQTDAAVNPGNSGGALVNIKGELVGINSAIASTTGAFSGYSFAIPITIVQKVTKDLMDYGSVQRAYIGIRIANVDENIANQLGLNKVTGVYVNEAVDNGAAKNAGIQAGDVIIKVGSKEVNTIPELQEAISRYRPGENVNFEVIRDRSRINMDVLLTNRNGDTKMSKITAKEITKIESLGIAIGEVSSEEKKRLSIYGGVKINEVTDGLFRGVGIKKGFIITSIDGTKVYDKKDFTRILSAKTGGILIEGVYPDGSPGYYGLGL